MYLLSLLMVGFSCNLKKNSAIDDVQRIATLSEKAVQIREERFNLSTKIRSIEDSLFKKVQTDTFHLKKLLDSLNSIKVKVLEATQLLADSIKIEMDKAMEKRSTIEGYKNSFDKEMKRKLRVVTIR